MKALLLNRISLVLAFAGIFVAGTLSLAHFLRQDVPCGASAGCAEITRSKQAYDPILHLPVAYYGLAAYLAFAALAAIRAANGMKGVRKPILIGTLVSAVGVAASGYLTYAALFEIKATCFWCLASASILVLTLLVHLLMLRAAEPESEPSDLDLKLMMALGIATTVALVGARGFFGGSQLIGLPVISKDKLATLPVTDLVPKESRIEGFKNAPVTIVEFGDLTCGYCRRVFPEVKEIVEKSKGKIRLVFRHLPLYNMEEHKHSLYGAFLAELAAEKDQYYQFIGAVYGFEESLEPQQMLQVASQVGVNPQEAETRFEKEDDPAWARLTRDLTFAQSVFKVQTTPVFIVFAEGVEERKQAKSIEELRLVLSSKAIADRISAP